MHTSYLFESQIDFREGDCYSWKFIQKIIHNVFWKTRNWFSTSSFSPFLKTEITFAILSFSGKASSSRDVLTIDKNGLYRIADININISVKTVATSGLALFQFLCFKLLCFFSMISYLVFTAFGRCLHGIIFLFI